MIVATGPLVVDLDQQAAWVSGRAVPFRPTGGTRHHREWLLLACLARNVDRLVPIQTLANEVLGWPDTGRYELHNLRIIRSRLVHRLGSECKPLIDVVAGCGVRLKREPSLVDILREPVRRAAETLTWIEARQGPLSDDGYARVEMTVANVRALARLLAVEPTDAHHN
jgi:hypothetical protein